MIDLDTLIEKVPRVSPVYQRRLKKLGIKTVHDLLFHFPHRYEDFSNIIPIADVKINENVCIQGKIIGLENKKTWVKKMILTEALIKDNTGAIKVIWFNQPYLVKTLKPSNGVCLAGKVLLDKSGAYLSNPAYEKISPPPKSITEDIVGGATSVNLVHTGRIIPVYPETEGLSSRWLRYILKPILEKFRHKIPEILPNEIIKKQGLLPINQAIWQVHFPESEGLAQKAKQRFSFEELFLLQLFVLKNKIKTAKKKSFSIPINLEIIKNFVESLPFKLTLAQKKCSWQILKSMEKPRPMSRLLQGDVGSGKTVVAAIAALNVARANYQASLMAPTEILAKQHFKNISNLLEKFDINIGLLTSKEAKIFSKKKEKKISRTKLLKHLKENETKFLIGTHALIQKQVGFGNLALVILDEQHRFGVEQRAKLVQTSSIANCQLPIPHLLSMTATPIPRSLALTIYGDLDLSIIDEMPKGRKKIITKIVAPENRQKAYDFIKKQVKNGRQVFVICPRIEPTTPDVSLLHFGYKVKDSSTSGVGKSWAEVKAVKEEYEKLSKDIFPDLKIGMLHGKMKTVQKEQTMLDFQDKKTDILVSTSVIEVGIDIPNATVMMIEGAERFGLAQLYQFRGRVGRSKHQSYCFLFTDSPAKKTQQRLSALVFCENGFELAEKDLKIRGAGDFFGARQSGIPDLAMASLKNIKLVEKTRETAKEILIKSPGLEKYPFLKERANRFGERIHLE